PNDNRVSVFNRLGTPAARTSVFERLGEASEDSSNNRRRRQRGSIFDRLGDSHAQQFKKKDGIQNAPPQLEDGVQATIDELKEMNLGTTEEPSPIFISALLSPEEEKQYFKTLGATYQRAVQNIFDDMLHKKVECYVDDLVVKTKKREEHLADLQIVFNRLKKYNLKMNHLKCAFGVTSEKFLGFIVCHCGALTLGKPLILYIAAQERSIGALMAQENEEGKEKTLYYLSRTLTENELKYSPVEKVCLALFYAIKKLKHYFEAYSIRLISRADPVKICAPKAVKGQALANFLAGHPMSAEWEISDDFSDEDVFSVEILPAWTMLFDKPSRSDGVGAGVVFVSP
ncbi:UNVERIFIED_CONTAM: hypothetical protein Scaly_0080400, partial [Sesamum calycinum]